MDSELELTIGYIIGYSAPIINFLLFGVVCLLPFIIGIYIFQHISKYRYKKLSSFWFFYIIIYIGILIYNADIISTPPVQEEDCNSIVRKATSDGFSKESCLRDLEWERNRKMKESSILFMDEIVQKGDPSDCIKTNDRDECYLKFGECTNIKNDYIISQCWYNKALQQNNYDFCKKTDFGMDNVCLTELALKNGDEKICQEIHGDVRVELDATQKQICLYNVFYSKISENGENKDCEIFDKNTEAGQNFRAKCFARIGECDSINGAGTAEIKYTCFKKIKECEKIDVPKLKDKCFGKMKECNKIIDTSLKQYCLDGNFEIFNY